MTVSEFFAQEGIVSIVPVVRVNVNGYPYVTCINASNEATNVYFASNVSSNYPEGTEIRKGFFNSLTVFRNEKGYWLFGSSIRVNIEDLF